MSQTPFLKKVRVLDQDVILFSDGSWQYYRPTKNSSSFVAGSNQMQLKKFDNLFFIPDSLAQPIVPIPCFSDHEILKDNSLFQSKTEFYKEVPQDGFLQTRMRFSTNQVPLFIAGENLEIVPLDSNQSIFLIKVFHRNGLESWYYPITKPNTAVDAKKPGNRIGFASKGFFWQLRFQNHSIALNGMLNRDFSCINEITLVESKNLADQHYKQRKKFFVASLDKTIIDQTPAPDFDKLLEQEMKKEKP
jgi:hypothetical protein